MTGNKQKILNVSTKIKMWRLLYSFWNKLLLMLQKKNNAKQKMLPCKWKQWNIKTKQIYLIAKDWTVHKTINFFFEIEMHVCNQMNGKITQFLVRFHKFVLRCWCWTQSIYVSIIMNFVSIGSSNFVMTMYYVIFYFNMNFTKDESDLIILSSRQFIQ